VNCHEVEGLLGAYADGELDLVRSLDTEAHVRDCAACSTALRRLEALHSTVLSQAPYYAAPPELRRKLAAHLEPRSGTFGSQMGVTYRQWWALAAACLVVALVIWRVAPIRSGPPIDKEVVAAHVRSLLAEHLMDVASTDRHTVKPWFTGKLDFAPDVQDLAAQGFPLAGGRLDYVNGQTVAALVYKRRQHTINLFIWPDNGERSSSSESLQGFHVIHWTKHGMTWWAISDLAEEELREFAALL